MLFRSFDAVEIPHFAPALEAAMAEHLREIDAIASSPEAPTFANVCEALERAGGLFQRVLAVYWTWSSSRSTAPRKSLSSSRRRRAGSPADSEPTT